MSGRSSDLEFCERPPPTHTHKLKTEYRAPVQSVLSGSVEAEFSSSQSSPGDAITSVVKTAKRSLLAHSHIRAETLK